MMKNLLIFHSISETYVDAVNYVEDEINPNSSISKPDQNQNVGGRFRRFHVCHGKRFLSMATYQFFCLFGVFFPPYNSI